MITAFSLTKNAIEMGEPITEAIVQLKNYVDEIFIIDMGSTDDTLQVLEDLKVRVYHHHYDNEKTSFELNNLAEFENILYFRPNEVFDLSLLKEIKELVVNYKIRNVSTKRIVVEQNFQRIRWYPEFVHRVFRRGKVKLSGMPNDIEIMEDDVEKFTDELSGVSTNKSHLKRMHYLNDDYGYLWAFYCCFLDNLVCENEETRRLVPRHFIKSSHLDTLKLSSQTHWKNTITPINIPRIMYPHLGKKTYNPYLTLRR